MTNEQQRIAIAEACGWKIHGRLKGLQRPDGSWENTTFNEDWRLPDYLNDLNATHEAEGTLKGDQQVDYILELGTYLFKAIHATAAQRAEAFLRTKGLWVES